MVVCRFYQSGSCKFGDQCKFEHPGASRSQNRFSTFGGGAKSSALSGSLPYSLSKEAIEKDLTTEAPTWILSCYGPGRDAPEQLFGGYPREQSTDEIRLHYEKGVQTGKQQEAIQEINQLYENARNQMQAAVSNLDNAIQFITDSANKHPNRQDIVDSANPPGRTPGEFAVGKRMNPTSSNPFGSGGTSTTSAFGSAPATGSAFGQTSALGQTPNPFGQPTPGFGQSGGGAFGKPAAPVFGATSTPTSAFGSASTTSAFGSASTTPAFGSTSTTSAFGKPSGAFGQPSQTAGSAFGQTSGMGQRTSAFGAPAAPAFGQTSQPGGGSAFGQPSQLGSTGGSAFGQPSGMGQKPNPFGAPAAASSGGSGFSAFANAAKTTSPFGATAGQGQPAASNSFAAAATGQPVASSPFGAVAAQGQPAASSPFGAAAAGQPVASNPFVAAQGQQAAQAAPNPFAKSGGMGSGMDAQPTSGGFGTQQAASSPFGQQPQQQQQQQAAPNPFGQPIPSPFGSAAAPSAPAPAGDAGNPYPPGAEKQHPPLESYASMSMGRLSAWKGRAVNYKGDVPGYVSGSGKWTRIWFPAGPPGYYADTEVAGGQLADEAKRVWEGFRGRFDVVPEVPPLRIHCQWDI